MIFVVTANEALAQQFVVQVNAIPIHSINQIPSSPESTSKSSSSYSSPSSYHYQQQQSQQPHVQAIIFDEALSVKESDLSWIRKTYLSAFITIYDPNASEKPHYRMIAFEAGANQVGYDVETIVQTLQEDVILKDHNNSSSSGNSSSSSSYSNRSQGYYTCPYCGLQNLTEDELWRHVPAFHINVTPNRSSSNPDVCPICSKELHREILQVHIHEHHGPRVRSMSNLEMRDSKLPNQLYNFSLVVCRHPVTGKYLLCQEFSNQGFWLPGGAVDGGEGLQHAAHRECLEEAGIKIDIKGILAVEYNPCGKQSSGSSSYLVRIRVIFYAEPTLEDLNKKPKSRPDFESAGACWCSAADVCDGGLKLRGNEPKHWIRYLEGGGTIYPLAVLAERDC